MSRIAALRGADRRLLTILAIVLVQMVGASMIVPTLPLYAEGEFGLSPELIALLATSFFGAQFLAGPVLGRLSDHYGRVPVLIVSQIGTAIAFLALGLAQSAWILFAARIFDGITGGNIIVAQAYVTDVTPRERRAEALGLILLAFGASFFVGPALGGVLASAFGVRAPYLIAAVAAALTVVLTWRTLDESLTEDERAANRASRGGLAARQVLENRPLVLASILVFGSRFGLGLVVATFALLGGDVIFDHWDDRTVPLGVGLLMTVVGLGQMGTQLGLIGRLLDRLGESRLATLAIVLRGLAFLGFALAGGPLLAFLASFLFAVGAGLYLPPVQSIATKVVDDTVRGGVLGLIGSIGGLGTIIATAVAGVLYGIAPQVPYWGGVVLSVLTLIPAVALVRLMDDRVPQSPTGQPG